MAEEKGKVVLIGKRGSGRTTLANMLVSGKLKDCPQPTDTDSICKTYVGRGWTVIDTMGFGTEPLGGIVPDECARKMTMDFLEEVKGRYSHIIFVVDGRDIGEPKFGRDDECTMSIMWKTYREIFKGGEENFVVLVTKVQPSTSVPTREEIEAMRTRAGFEDAWFTEVLLMFPECKQFLFADFPMVPKVSVSEATVEELFSKRQEELERLEKEMTEMVKANPWAEPDMSKMGDGEMSEKAGKIIRELTSSRAGKLRDWESWHGSVYEPVVFYVHRPVIDYRHHRFEFDVRHHRKVSDKDLLKGKADAVLVVVEEMQDLGKEVKFYYRQCEYLLQRSVAASTEIHDLFDGMNWSERLLTHFLDRLIKSLDDLICSMMAGKELLHLCGNSGKEQEVALTLSPPGSGTNSFSKFALVLRDIDWSMDACRFLFHNVEVDRGSRSDRQSWVSKFSSSWFHVAKVERAAQSERQSYLSKFMWCEARCRMVYMRDDENKVADVDLAESCVAADNDRHAHDQHDLMSCMESHFSTSQYPRRVQNEKQLSSSEIFSYMSILKNRLQGDSSFDGPNTMPGCFSIPGNQEFRSIQLLGEGSYKEVHECEWLGMNVAVATSQNQGRPFRPVLEAEAGALARVQHPNVVSFIGFAYDEEKSQGYLVTELMQTSLRALIDRGNRRRYSSAYPFTISESIDILLQIVEAMIHVHECGVMHRDLKADNLLAHRAFDCVGGGLYVAVVKLIDFGTSKPQSAEMGSNFKTKNVGTRAWMAPEVIRQDGNEMQLYTMSADVYSFGMTCYEILTGEIPFRLCMGRALPEAICAGQRPPVPDNCPDGLRELMTKCWTHIPDDRPTFKEIRRKLWSLKLYYTICEP